MTVSLSAKGRTAKKQCDYKLSVVTVQTGQDQKEKEHIS